MRPTFNTTEPYQKRVARGALVYDQYDLDWWKKVDENRLDMASAFRCLWAQVSGKEWSHEVYAPIVGKFGREKYFDQETGKWKPGWKKFLVEHGFAISFRGPLLTRGRRKGQVPMYVKYRYDKLTVLWQEEIRKRKQASACDGSLDCL